MKQIAIIELCRYLFKGKWNQLTLLCWVEKKIFRPQIFLYASFGVPIRCVNDIKQISLNIKEIRLDTIFFNNI